MTLSGWEAVFFWVFSFAALFAGLLTILARSAVHAALMIVFGCVGVLASAFALSKINRRSRDFNLKTQRRGLRLLNLPQGKPAVPVVVAAQPEG